MALPRVLLLVLALLQATGVVDLVRREACIADCRDDGCDDDCAPGSGAPSCPCHCPAAPTMTPPITAVVTLTAPQSSDVIFDRTERAHTSPDPREILHVPRHVV